MSYKERLHLHNLISCYENKEDVVQSSTKNILYHHSLYVNIELFLPVISTKFVHLHVFISKTLKVLCYVNNLHVYVNIILHINTCMYFQVSLKKLKGICSICNPLQVQFYDRCIVPKRIHGLAYVHLKLCQDSIPH